MSSRILYVAEPIDQSDLGPWKVAVADMVRIAVKAGWLCFRPAEAWSLTPDAPVGPEIETLNRSVLEDAGALIAFLPSGVPTVGVPRELEFAQHVGIPSIVVTDKPGWSLYDVDTIEFDNQPAFGAWLEDVPLRLTERDAIYFHRTSSAGQIPTRAHDGDAGFDLYASDDREIPPGRFVDVPCDLRVAFPPGVWGRIIGRSSTLRKRQLMVTEGVIDTGYRGELYAGVWNLGDVTHTVHAGERIAQLVLEYNVTRLFEPALVEGTEFERIPGDGRGGAGFGSSGA